MKFFNARRNAYHTDPKQIDDVIYTPYAYEAPFQGPEPMTPVTPAVGTTGDLLGVPELRVEGELTHGENGQERRARKRSKFDMPEKAEVFVFKYGTVVIWGMTEAQEKRFLTSMCVVWMDPIFTILTPEAENASK